MAQYTERNALLIELCVTEAELKQLRQLDPADAKWRIDHELKMDTEWARRRHAFRIAEVLKPRKVKKVRKKQLVVTGEPPIVSHRSGRGQVRSVHGEKFG